MQQHKVLTLIHALRARKTLALLMHALKTRLLPIGQIGGRSQQTIVEQMQRAAHAKLLEIYAMPFMKGNTQETLLEWTAHQKKAMVVEMERIAQLQPFLLVHSSWPQPLCSDRERNRTRRSLT